MFFFWWNNQNQKNDLVLFLGFSIFSFLRNKNSPMKASKEKEALARRVSFAGGSEVLKVIYRVMIKARNGLQASLAYSLENKIVFI